MAVKVDREKCTGCSACVEVCPAGAIKIEKDKAIISDECVECGVCLEQCPNEALSLSE
ncbi:MAG: 4Fe-4S binding protein [Candidatus Omnitrophica bacterium]|nr:4Fe-4S binding protein [Candidatus Omnitrophota bacterium]